MPAWLTLGTVADVCGIAGFVFSVLIWKMAGKLKAQISVYRRQQKDIVLNLRAQRDCILLDNIYTIGVRSELRTELYGLLKSYDALLSLGEKWRIRQALGMLSKKKPEEVDREVLCAHLDYIIARFRKKEVAP